MDKPILNFFDEESLINKKSYTANSSGLEREQLLQKHNITTALFVFIRENIETMVDINKLEPFYIFKNGSNCNECYIYDKKFILAITPLGGPAAGGLMEELGFMGITNFFACGSAGQINHDIDPSHFILVDKAIRCEGTSYSYLPASLYAYTDKELTDYLANYLNDNNYKYTTAATWTTDSFYRETQSELELRVSQGAVSVEMECASWCAISKYRGYKFTQLLYFSDALKQEGWKWKLDRKELKKSIINLMIDCVGKYSK